MTKTKNTNSAYRVQLSNRRKVNVSPFKGAVWIHVTDNKTGNHVTLNKKDYNKLIQQSSKISGYIKKVESKLGGGKRNDKNSKKKGGEDDNSASSSNGEEDSGEEEAESSS